MGTTNSGEAVAFTSVYDFCGGDQEMYFEILEEIKLSVENLVTLIDQGGHDLEAIRFTRHKMKSTFRILKDDDFKQLLDDFTKGVEDSNSTVVAAKKAELLKVSQDYLLSLTTEITRLS